jgi:hypothetical protein
MIDVFHIHTELSKVVTYKQPASKPVRDLCNLVGVNSVTGAYGAQNTFSVDKIVWEQHLLAVCLEPGYLQQHANIVEIAAKTGISIFNIPKQ